jgi:hypothetical protein
MTDYDFRSLTLRGVELPFIGIPYSELHRGTSRGTVRGTIECFNRRTGAPLGRVRWDPDAVDVALTVPVERARLGAALQRIEEDYAANERRRKGKQGDNHGKEERK